jgi:hypothetical protein
LDKEIAMGLFSSLTTDTLVSYNGSLVDTEEVKPERKPVMLNPGVLNERIAKIKERNLALETYEAKRKAEEELTAEGAVKKSVKDTLKQNKKPPAKKTDVKKLTLNGLQKFHKSLRRKVMGESLSAIICACPYDADLRKQFWKKELKAYIAEMCSSILDGFEGNRPGFLTGNNTGGISDFAYELYELADSCAFLEANRRFSSESYIAATGDTLECDMTNAEAYCKRMMESIEFDDPILSVHYRRLEKNIQYSYEDIVAKIRKKLVKEVSRYKKNAEKIADIKDTMTDKLSKDEDPLKPSEPENPIGDDTMDSDDPNGGDTTTDTADDMGTSNDTLGDDQSDAEESPNDTSDDSDTTDDVSNDTSLSKESIIFGDSPAVQRAKEHILAIKGDAKELITAAQKELGLKFCDDYTQENLMKLAERDTEKLKRHLVKIVGHSIALREKHKIPHEYYYIEPGYVGFSEVVLQNSINGGVYFYNKTFLKDIWKLSNPNIISKEGTVKIARTYRDFTKNHLFDAVIINLFGVRTDVIRAMRQKMNTEGLNTDESPITLEDSLSPGDKILIENASYMADRYGYTANMGEEKFNTLYKQFLAELDEAIKSGDVNRMEELQRTIKYTLTRVSGVSDVYDQKYQDMVHKLTELQETIAFEKNKTVKHRVSVSEDNRTILEQFILNIGKRYKTKLALEGLGVDSIPGKSVFNESYIYAATLETFNTLKLLNLTYEADFAFFNNFMKEVMNKA